MYNVYVYECKNNLSKNKANIIKIIRLKNQKKNIILKINIHNKS